MPCLTYWFVDGGRGKTTNDLVDRDRELPANLAIHTDTFGFGVGLFFSFFGLEDPSQSLDKADGWHPINHLGLKKLSWTGGQGAFLFLEQTLGGSPYKWVTLKFPQSISLTTKTSVYPNRVVPPHSCEKPIN